MSTSTQLQQRKRAIRSAFKIATRRIGIHISGNKYVVQHNGIEQMLSLNSSSASLLFSIHAGIYVIRDGSPRDKCPTHYDITRSAMAVGLPPTEVAKVLSFADEIGATERLATIEAIVTCLYRWLQELDTPVKVKLFIEAYIRTGQPPATIFTSILEHFGIHRNEAIDSRANSN